MPFDGLHAVGVTDLNVAANRDRLTAVRVYQGDNLDDPGTLFHLVYWKISLEHKCDFVISVKVVVGLIN